MSLGHLHAFKSICVISEPVRISSSTFGVVKILVIAICFPKKG